MKKLEFELETVTPLRAITPERFLSRMPSRCPKVSGLSATPAHILSKPGGGRRNLSTTGLESGVARSGHWRNMALVVLLFDVH